MGTRETIVPTQVLLQNSNNQRNDVMMCDFEKAFDKVQHYKLVQILKRLNIHQKDVRCIENLSWNQTTKVRVEDEHTEPIKVQQGCVLSPPLFNMYYENNFQEKLEKCDLGNKVNGVWVNSIRYADDTVLFADKVKNLQHLLNTFNDSSSNMSISINSMKTKFVIVTRKPEKH